MTNNQQQLSTNKKLFQLTQEISQLYSHIVDIKRDINKQTKAFLELIKSISSDDVLSNSEKLHILNCMQEENDNGKSKTTTTR